MSPTRNPDSSFILEDTASAPTPESTTPAIPKGRTKKRAVFVPLTPTGQLDVDRIRDTSEIEQARAALGVVDPSTLPPPEKAKIRDEYILPAYSLLEVGIRAAGRYLLKWPEELVVEMKFDSEKKQKLVQPTAEIVAKYAPSWLIENQDMAALGALLTDAIDDMINTGVARYQAKLQARQQPLTTDSAQGRVFTSVPPTNGASVAA